MKHACALLKDTSLRVNEILTACGYVDKANFMRKFKRQFGMTPTEYRKANSQLPFEGSAANDDNGDEPEKENIQE